MIGIINQGSKFFSKPWTYINLIAAIFVIGLLFLHFSSDIQNRQANAREAKLVASQVLGEGYDFSPIECDGYNRCRMFYESIAEKPYDAGSCDCWGTDNHGWRCWCR